MGSSLQRSNKQFRSGFVTLVGRPNVGKSTLINALLEKKLAIVSDTAQTTRHRFRAIVDDKHMQLILVDTPGIHKPKDNLGVALNESALKALEDSDIVSFLIDSTQQVGRGDKWVASKLNALRVPKILIITKADLSSQKRIKTQIDLASKLAHFDDIVVLSAQEKYNLESFKQIAYKYLPEGPRWFPEGSDVDLNDEVLIAEFIREKLLLNTYEEVPHSVGVVVDEIIDYEDKKLMSVYTTIYVERDNQKGIIIGKRGNRIKKIGISARKDLERIYSTQVYLDLNVKVKKNWRQDANIIKRFGYAE